jgi:adenosylhomocysteine nucleosidase
MSVHVLAAMPEEIRSFCKNRFTIHVTGVGKANAAIAGSFLWLDTVAAREDLVRFFFVGTAAACDPGLEIGDIIISTDTLHHDMDVTSLGFAPGQIPFEKTWCWESDRRLQTRALSVCRRLGLRHTAGRIITGDQFVSDLNHVSELHRIFNAACIDMETAGFAQGIHKLPDQAVSWLGIRIISDKADKSASVDFTEFLPRASKTLARIVEGIILDE